jgi:hypothetical protein
MSRVQFERFVHESGTEKMEAIKDERVLALARAQLNVLGVGKGRSRFAVTLLQRQRNAQEGPGLRSVAALTGDGATDYFFG